MAGSEKMKTVRKG